MGSRGVDLRYGIPIYTNGIPHFSEKPKFQIESLGAPTTSGHYSQMKFPEMVVLEKPHWSWKYDIPRGGFLEWVYPKTIGFNAKMI